MGLLALSAALCQAAPASTDLTGVRLVVDANQPRYVKRAVGELRDYLKEITGADVPSSASLGSGDGPVITIGPGIAARLLPDPVPAEKLGEEGYLLRSVARGIVVAGATAKGAKHGVYALMKLLASDGLKPLIEGSLDVTSKPSFALRGMHLNGWPINYPYTFRKWREEDWKRYIDILSCQGVNLLYIWPFMDIIPVPLSKADESYLREFRRVVDYAQTEHGMEVWMMQSANRVATGDCGVADPRDRPYWKSDVQVDMNPADPEQFKKIMDSREALFRVVDNVDGVCTIDSDPGGWAGSPVSDWVKILNGCRSFLDKYSIHGSRAKLICWLHLGWGRTGEVDFSRPQEEVIRGIKEGVPEPLMFIAGWNPILKMCKDEGVIGKTISFPYGTIEGEPSYPSTEVGIGGPRDTLRVMCSYRDDAAGAMGNAQTPLLQFPREHFYVSTLWDHDYLNRTEKEALLDVSTLLYPENRALIADCFAALREISPRKVKALAGRLDTLIKENKLGRPGALGRKLFPDTSIVARSLLVQLNLKAAEEAVFAGVTGEASLPECAALIAGFLDAYFAWEKEHGWHEYWDRNYGWGHGWPLGRMSEYRRFGPLVSLLARKLGDSAGVDSFLADVALKLKGKYPEDSINKFGVAPFKNAIRTVVVTIGI